MCVGMRRRLTREGEGKEGSGREFGGVGERRRLARQGRVKGGRGKVDDVCGEGRG